ncbi:hypothetical protein BDN71DRAFT_1550387 [Pleurotus eryngii]|uniref:Uncharacterized protein n=1 Tax=Pleurotus eryngii TaxID=5323 RepID=A0A9P6A9B2_PLEER|nr:hypothetical protein BDN71DRAFT_1550387 [Pleurotus eryngii]
MASLSTTTIDTRREPVYRHPASHGSLPHELIESLNRAYWLHVLAVDPSQILPPGKSLLAMMTRIGAHRSEGKSDLHRTVEGIVHKAFWDEAIESLSSPIPSAQLARLKLLYADLSTAITPLLPPDHSVLVQLSSPLPPTSSPLLTCLTLLKEVVIALRERCAPVRDGDFLQVMKRLDEPNAVPTTPPLKTTKEAVPHLPIAVCIVDVIQSIITLSEHMKSDLEQFTLGTMSESQLKATITLQAKRRERDLITELWRTDEEKGEDVAQRLWNQWASEPLEPHLQLWSEDRTHHARWVLRLVQALASSVSISCNVPTPQDRPSAAKHPVPASPLTSTPSHKNSLPPQFLLSSPSLFYLQNLLQAIVISAALRTLPRLPAPSSTSATAPGGDFMERIWSLLRSEVDQPDDTPGATKLINFEDEVVRARTLAVTHHPASVPNLGTDPSSATPSAPPMGKEEEARLRAAVQRTLQTQDPVFVLLQTRLLVSMAKYSVDLVALSPVDQPAGGVPSGGSSFVSHGAPYAPSSMQTGRDGGRPEKRLRLSSPSELPQNAESPKHVALIKGFEDPVLVRAIEEAFSKFARCTKWVAETWQDVI